MNTTWIPSGGWSFEPTVLLGLIIAAALYWLGLKYSIDAGLERRFAWWRPVCFGAGLVTIIIALESPIDTWALTYLWAHMVQHALLIFVAAPLLLFGAPLMPLLRAIPLDARRSSLRWLMTNRRPRRVALAIGHGIASPRGVWLLFVGDYLAWHVPALYDLALRDQGIHDIEHLLFLGTALLFWAQIIPSAPLRPRLGFAAQALFTITGGFALQTVEMVLTYSGSPFYAHYAQVQRSTGAISALVDQTSAGALMGAIGTAIFGTVFMVLLWRWFDEAQRREASTRGVGL
ncbi:MAG: cytochrome c oxidase assembly protein [Chloroflexota bacterium]|nr:cytochrome c oxidase assembly protein [Chloroflexota bacterium]